MLSLTGLSQEDLSRLLSGRSHLHTLLMLFPEQTASPVHPRHHSPPRCTLQPTSLPRSPSTYPPKVGGLPQGFPCPHSLGRAPSASMTPQSSARAPMLGAERWLISRPPAEASLVLFPPTDKRLVPASPHRSPQHYPCCTGPGDVATWMSTTPSLQIRQVGTRLPGPRTLLGNPVRFQC